LIRKIRDQFSIGDVARMAGVDSRVLRAWEERGQIPPARRNGANHRVYSFDEARRIVHLSAGEQNRRIAVVNQKGGVGKTTTTFSLAGALVARGRKILVVDLDPQANLTSSLGIELGEQDRSVEDVFVDDDFDAADAIRPTRFPGLFCLPARPRLAGVEIKIFDAFLRETILDRKLTPLHDRFDFILIDCPPNLSLVTVNALVACQEALVPIEAQTYSIKAISDLTNTVALIRSRLDRGVTLRFVPTKIDNRLKVASEILDAIKDGLKNRVMPSIRTDAHLVRCPMLRTPVSFAFPNSKGAKDYDRIAGILVKEKGPPGPDGRPEEHPEEHEGGGSQAHA